MTSKRGYQAKWAQQGLRQQESLWDPWSTQFWRMHAKGLHSGIELEFPKEGVFTYRTSKANANVHTSKILLLQDRN